MQWAAADAAAETLGAPAAERPGGADAVEADPAVPAQRPSLRPRLRAAELLAAAVWSALGAPAPAPSAALSAARRSAASCSVCRSGEGEPAAATGSTEALSAGERMPLGVVWRLVGVDASGVLLMALSSLATTCLTDSQEQGSRGTNQNVFWHGRCLWAGFAGDSSGKHAAGCQRSANSLRALPKNPTSRHVCQGALVSRR